MAGPLRKRKAENWGIGRGTQVIFGLCRLYLFGRVVQNLVLADLPLRHSVSVSADVDVGATFALKRIMGNLKSAAAVAIFWAVCLLVLAMLYRVGEITACDLESALDVRCEEVEQAKFWTHDGISFFEKTNDLYIQNAAWLSQYQAFRATMNTLHSTAYCLT